LKVIENRLIKPAIKNLLPLQDGYEPSSHADVTDLGYKPNTSIQAGIVKIIDWYFDFYKKEL